MIRDRNEPARPRRHRVRSRSSTSPRSAAGSARAIDEAIARVLDHCQFILGPEVRAFEAELAAFCGARHAISCASGTDALVLVLMAKGIGPGDAVICPTFTFCATAEVAALVGATPVFADVEEDELQPRSRRACERAIADRAQGSGCKPQGGHPGRSVRPAGRPRRDRRGRRGREAVRARRRRAGVRRDLHATAGSARSRHATATSFFPAKPLGCYGDGGAVLTDDDELARDHAQPARARRGPRQIRQRAHRHSTAGSTPSRPRC